MRGTDAACLLAITSKQANLETACPITVTAKLPHRSLLLLPLQSLLLNCDSNLLASLLNDQGLERSSRDATKQRTLCKGVPDREWSKGAEGQASQGASVQTAVRTETSRWQRAGGLLQWAHIRLEGLLSKAASKPSCSRGAALQPAAPLHYCGGGGRKPGGGPPGGGMPGRQPGGGPPMGGMPGGGIPGGGMPGLRLGRGTGRVRCATIEPALLSLSSTAARHRSACRRSAVCTTCAQLRSAGSVQHNRPNRTVWQQQQGAHRKPGGGMPGGGIMPGGGMPGRIMGGACTAGRGIIWPGPGAPTPGAGPARPTGAAPGAATGMPRPAARPMPGPAGAAAPLASRLSSAGGGPSIVRSTTSSPRRITRPSTRRSSRCGGEEHGTQQHVVSGGGNRAWAAHCCGVMLDFRGIRSLHAASFRCQPSAQELKQHSSRSRRPPTRPSWAAACGTPPSRPAPGSCAGQTP